MVVVKNIKSSDDILTFEVDNKSCEYKLSLCNGLRRIILSEIDLFCLDENKINFEENNSVLNNEFLKHRLSLIPFICDKNYDYEKLVIRCIAKNESENIKSVYSSDFEIYDEDTQTKLNIKNYLKYPNILFSKLQNNEYFSFEARFSKGNAFKYGAQYCPVSSCVVTFKKDENQIKEITKGYSETEKKSFNLLDSERIYKLNKTGEPEIFEFRIESIGFYETKTIIKKAIDILKEKVDYFKDKLDDLEFVNSFFELRLYESNDTIGNLISSYLLDVDEISYSGYLIEHPLKNEVLFKFKTSLNKKSLIDKIKIKLKEINGLLDKLKKEF